MVGDANHGYAAKVAFSIPTATSERSMDHADGAKLSEAATLSWTDYEDGYRFDFPAWDATPTAVYLGYGGRLYRIARQF